MSAAAQGVVHAGGVGEEIERFIHRHPSTSAIFLPIGNGEGLLL